MIRYQDCHMQHLESDLETESLINRFWRKKKKLLNPFADVPIEYNPNKYQNPSVDYLLYISQEYRRIKPKMFVKNSARGTKQAQIPIQSAAG